MTYVSGWGGSSALAMELFQSWRLGHRFDNLMWYVILSNSWEIKFYIKIYIYTCMCVFIYIYILYTYVYIYIWYHLLRICFVIAVPLFIRSYVQDMNVYCAYPILIPLQTSIMIPICPQMWYRDFKKWWHDNIGAIKFTLKREWKYR